MTLFLVGRLKALLVSLFCALLLACSYSAPELPDVSGVYAQCGLVEGRDCDGTHRADECAARGLPSAYGVDAGCRILMKENCEKKAQGTLWCVKDGDLLCCPK